MIKDTLCLRGGLHVLISFCTLMYFDPNNENDTLRKGNVFVAELYDGILVNTPQQRLQHTTLRIKLKLRIEKISLRLPKNRPVWQRKRFVKPTLTLTAMVNPTRSMVAP